MIALSDLGMFSVADGVIYALAVTVLFPSMAPYFLVAICSFQDAAGLSMFWWYAGTVLFGLIVISSWSANKGIQALMASRVALPVMAALIVIVYAASISMLQIFLHGHPQSESRPPLIVGGLMAWMMFAGVAATFELFRDDRFADRLRWLVLVLVANGLLVAFSKAIFGLEVFASASGLEQVREATQLIKPSSLGLPRLIGTYLTPNGFALCYGLLMLLLLTAKTRVSDAYTIGYALLGGVLALITFSKAMAVFFAVSILILIAQSRYAKYALFVIGTCGLIIVVYLGAGVEWQVLAEAFRVPTGGAGGLGYRSEAWKLVMQTFTIPDWLFGTGLAYWPILFEQNLGYSLSDPHTYLLSIPGTYGLLGVMFYVLMGLRLAGVVKNESGAKAALAFILLILFFVKDIASIPYLIGNTPLTLLIWMLIAGTLISMRDEQAACDQQP